MNSNQYNKLCERKNYWARLAKTIPIREGLWEHWEDCYSAFLSPDHFSLWKEIQVPAPFFMFLKSEARGLDILQNVFEYLLYIRHWTCAKNTSVNKANMSLYAHMQLWEDKQTHRQLIGWGLILQGQNFCFGNLQESS